MKTPRIFSAAPLLFALTALIAPALAQLPPAGYEWRSTGETAQCTSPYPNNAKGLRTEIHVDGAVFLKLHFAYSDFEQGFDFLRILDERDAIVLNLTGVQENFDSPIIKGSAALLDLYSDYSASGRGFLIDRVEACVPAAAAPPPVGDGPRWVEEAVLVQSPAPYANDLNRQPYPIQHPGAKAIKLHFDLIDMEQNFDFLDVFDEAGNSICRVTGKRRDFWTDAIQGDRVVVALTSDFSESGRGFVVDRIAAYVPSAAPPLPPGPVPPAHGNLAQVRYFLGGAPGTPLAPFPEGVIELRPRGQTPDRFVLVVQGFDASGRQVPTDRLDIHSEIHGDVGSIRAAGPGEFLFESSSLPGRSGELHLWIPGFGDLPEIQIDVFARGGHGRDHDHDRSPLTGMVAELLTADGAPCAPDGNAYTLFLGTPGRDRALVSFRGTDAQGGPARVRGPISYRIRGVANSLSVVEGERGVFTVIAGSVPRDNLTVEFFTTGPRDREITAQVRFRVLPPPRALTSLPVTLDGGDPIGDGTLLMIAGGPPVIVTVTPLDQLGRLFTPPGLRVGAEITGDPVVQIADLGECRFQLTPRVHPGQGSVFFRDGTGTVRSVGIDITVKLPRFHHAEIFIQQGDQWVAAPQGPLSLDPLGLGQDSCILDVRCFDELGNLMPDSGFAPRLSLIGARTIAIDRVAPSRYRLRSTAAVGEEGVQLQLREPNGRDIILSCPVQVIVPTPRLTSLRIFDLATPRVELTDQVVLISAIGDQPYRDFEVIAFDQFGQPCVGLALQPGFTFRDGASPCLIRRISETPSVWRLQPKVDECVPMRLEVGLRGSPIIANFMVGVVDPTFVQVGTKRADDWVKWGHRRDYDFMVELQLGRSRAVKLRVANRFAVESISLRLFNGQYMEIGIQKQTLAAGQTVRFELPETKDGFTLVRINGYSDPGCELALSVKQPELPAPGHGPGGR